MDTAWDFIWVGLVILLIKADSQLWRSVLRWGALAALVRFHFMSLMDRWLTVDSTRLAIDSRKSERESETEMEIGPNSLCSTLRLPAIFSLWLFNSSFHMHVCKKFHDFGFLQYGCSLLFTLALQLLKLLRCTPSVIIRNVRDGRRSQISFAIYGTLKIKRECLQGKLGKPMMLFWSSRHHWHTMWAWKVLGYG